MKPNKTTSSRPPKDTICQINGLHPSLHIKASNLIKKGDAVGFMNLVYNKEKSELLRLNYALLMETGLIEKAFTHTYINGSVCAGINISPWLACACLRGMDRARLAACGDTPIPTSPVTLFRGVRNTAARQYIRGISWSACPNTAAWFALRFKSSPRPAVYQLTVPPERIFMITNEMNEQEALIDPMGLPGLTRLREMPEPIQPPDEFFDKLKAKSPASGQTGGASGMGLGG